MNDNIELKALDALCNMHHITKEEIEDRIADIETNLNIDRATGKTHRILNQIIEKFFQEPIGTKIEIADHCDNIVNNIWLCQMVRRRIDSEYPDAQYELNGKSKPYYVIRKSMTQKEKLESELAKYKELLKEL